MGDDVRERERARTQCGEYWRRFLSRSTKLAQNRAAERAVVNFVPFSTKFGDFLNCPEARFFARVRRDRTSTVPDQNDLAARALLPPQKWGGKRAGEGFIARFAVFLVT